METGRKSTRRLAALAALLLPVCLAAGGCGGRERAKAAQKG